MMLEDVACWSQKLHTGLELAQKFYQDKSDKLPQQIKKVAFFGMGGSGIVGSLLKTFFDKQSSPQCYSINSPIVPEYIGKDTFAIVISYSGNTWETVTALKQLVAKKIPFMIFAHGGRAQEIADNSGYLFVKAPEALTPRSSLGYMMGFFMGLLDSLDALDNGQKMALDFCAHADEHVKTFQNEKYFQEFIDLAKNYETFHIWGVTGDTDAAAYRAQTQFNENSKVHAVASAFPELCHNLIVGFTNCHNSPLVVQMSTSSIPDYLTKALVATEELMLEKGVNLYKVPVLGDTFHSQLFNAILWADFASCYLGNARGAELVPVKLIDSLKRKHKEKGISV